MSHSAAVLLAQRALGGSPVQHKHTRTDTLAHPSTRRGPQRREERRSSAQSGRGSVTDRRGRVGDAPVQGTEQTKSCEMWGCIHATPLWSTSICFSVLTDTDSEYFNEAVAHYRITDVCLFGHNSSARFGVTDTSFTGNRYWYL